MLFEKAKPIKLLILDVDGVLTNGMLYYDNQGVEIKGFHIHDGLGIKLLQKAGIPVAIISGRKSAAVEMRVKQLNIEHFYLGNEDKLPAYTELKQKLNLSDAQIAFMGDDLPDLPLLKRVGLSITVPQAPVIIREYADLITTLNGGKGAVREACETILQAQGKYQTVTENYFS